MKQVKVKKLHPDAIIPKYATAGAACFDLHCIEDGLKAHPKDEHAAIFRTGLAFEIPDDHAMLIFSRSGHGFKDALRLSNCVGVIDQDYVGEVMVSLRFDASGEYRCSKVRPGDRIAQAMILPVQQVQLLEVEELKSTQRGTSGFGSTGK